jgi:putative chitinase
MRAHELLVERKRSWGIGDINLMFDEPGPGEPADKTYHLRQRQDERGVTDRERDAILKQLPMVRRRMLEFTRGQEFWLYDPKLNKAVGLKVLDYKNKIYSVSTVLGKLPADADNVLHVPGVDPQSLQEGWRDTLAGLAMGGLAATASAHVVKPGDTVYSIARANNTTPAAIAQANRLGPDFNIAVGQRLRIPGSRDALDAQRRAELARLGYTDRDAPAAPQAAPAKPKAAAVSQLQVAKPKSTKSLDPTKTWTGTRGEALVTQAALDSGIRKRSELAALLAQTAHESSNFRVMGEDLSYSARGLMSTFPTAFPNARIASQYANRPRAIANRAYANRMGNGNEASGDGWRYRGRGYIQITGRDNYRRAGQALGLPLERQPDLASEPEVAAKVAVWYWKNRTRPNVRDFYDVRKVTGTINPAQRGARDREENFADFYQWLASREQRI